MQKELEERFISVIKTSEELAAATTKGISRDTFIIYREPFEFLAKYIVKHDNAPAPAILEANFLDFKFVHGVQESERNYLIDELLKAETRRKTISILDKGADLIQKDAYGGVDFIITQLSKVRNVPCSVNVTDGNALERLERAKERKAKLDSGGIVGLRTGLSFIDKHLLGWQLGNMISIIARMKKGKTWLALYLACSVYLEGARVLFISPEMPIPQIEDRFDPIMGALLDYKFSNKGLMTGQVDFAKYEKYLKEIKKRKDWITVDSDGSKPFTIPAIKNLIDLYAPDVVVIDGFVALDIGEKSWDNMCSAAAELKAYTQAKKIITLVTSQATRSAKGLIPDETMVYGGDALGQNSDVLIMVGDDPDEPKVRWLSIGMVRAGEGFNKKVKISFDVDSGQIGV